MSRKHKKYKRDNLVFTKHVKERMIERGISKEAVKEVIKYPDYTRNYGQVKVSFKKQLTTGLTRKKLKVIWKLDNNQIIIKTVYCIFFKKP